MRSYSASELSLIRTRPQGANWYLAIHKPRPVAHYIQNGSVSYPLSSVPVTFLSGASQAIRQSQTVLVGSASGQRDLGVARLVDTTASNNTVLLISESGSGLINWKDGQTYLTVMNEIRPWPKHPRYDASASQWRMDYYTAFSEQIQYAPYPNMDGTFVHVMPSGTSSFTASFIGNDSVFLGNPYLANAWYFPDGGTSTDLGTEASPVTRTFSGTSPGGSYVRLQLVDSGGGSTMGHRLLFLFDDLSQVARVSMAEVSGGLDSGGYSTQLTVYNLNDTDLPVGTEIIIFEDPNYGGSHTSVGTNSVLNKNVIFRGWTSAEVTTVNPLTSTATIEAETIHGIMSEMASYDIFMAKSALTGASHWIESENLSLDRISHQLLRWRSTVSEVTNWTPASGLAISDNIQFQSLGKGNLFNQLRSNYGDRGYLGFFASDMQSNLFSCEDGQITGASASIDKVINLLDEDKRDVIQIERNYRPKNAQVQLYAVASVTPLGAESPGNVMGYFGTQQEISQGLLVDTQDTLITWSGNLRAKLNADFPNVSVPLVGNYKIDAVPQTRVSISLSSTQNARGYEWTNKDFWLNETVTRYDSTAGYVTQDLSLSEVVDGMGGSSVTFPAVSEIIPAPTPAPSVSPAPTISAGFGTGFGTVYVMTTSVLGRTRDFSAASPNWSAIQPSATGLIQEFILDPWTPATTGYLAADNGIWRSTDLDQASPSWDHVLTKSDLSSNTGGSDIQGFGHLEASINSDGYVAYFTQITDITDLYCIYTGDRGDTWNYSLIASSLNTNDGWRGAAGIVQHVVGGNIRMYCAVKQGFILDDLSRFRSDDGGATWTRVANDLSGGVTAIRSSSIHIPYNDNPNGTTWYLGANVQAVTTDGGVTFTSIASYAGGGNSQVHRWSIESFTNDRQKMYRVDKANCQIHTTDDGFSTENTPPAMNGATGQITSTGGFPTQDSQFYMLTTSGIYVTIDRGENWSNKLGDWYTIDTTSSIELMLANDERRGVIVPLWTE